jgi:hypothetical protein
MAGNTAPDKLPKWGIPLVVIPVKILRFLVN